MEYFVWPIVFLLLPLPFLVRWLLPAQKQTTAFGAEALRVPFFKEIERFSIPLGQINPKNAKWELILFWLLCVLASARPVWYGEPEFITQSARNIVLALDASGSMAEQDFDVNNKPVTRLTLVKLLADDFLEKRTGDEVSLVVFGSEAFTYTPLTYDTTSARKLLREIDVGIAGEMTAIGDALALSAANVSKVPAQSRIVVLLSDGTSNAGQVQVEEALQLAQKLGVKVYTIGIGSAPKAIRTFLGFNQLVNPAADLDEATLKAIANQTGGAYFRAKTSEDLSAIYQTINALEPVESDDVVFVPRKELFYVPLIGALLFLLIAVLKRRVV